MWLLWLLTLVFSIIVSIVKHYQSFVKEIFAPKEKKKWAYENTFKQKEI